MRKSTTLTATLLFAFGSQSVCAQDNSQTADAENAAKIQSVPDIDKPKLGQDVEKTPPPPAADESFAEESEPEREPSAEALAGLAVIDAALKKVDKDIKREGNGWQFMMGANTVLVVSDPLAGRMRVMVPIVPADALTPDVVVRIMQANFDSALDARYAVAQNLLWGTYIHSLIGLDEKEFLSGLLQTINIVETFGTSFSSGVVVFGGGDSQTIIEGQLEELLKKQQEDSRI